MLVQGEGVEPIDAARVLFFVAEHTLNGVSQVVGVSVANEDIGLSDILGLEDFDQGALVGGGGYDSELLLQLPRLHLRVGVKKEMAEKLGIDTLARTDNRGSTFRGGGLATARTGKIISLLLSPGVLFLLLLNVLGFGVDYLVGGSILLGGSRFSGSRLCRRVRMHGFA